MSEWEVFAKKRTPLWRSKLAFGVAALWSCVGLAYLHLYKTTRTDPISYTVSPTRNRREFLTEMHERHIPRIQAVRREVERFYQLSTSGRLRPQEFAMRKHSQIEFLRDSITELYSEPVPPADLDSYRKLARSHKHFYNCILLTEIGVETETADRQEKFRVAGMALKTGMQASLEGEAQLQQALKAEGL